MLLLQSGGASANTAESVASLDRLQLVEMAELLGFEPILLSLTGSAQLGLWLSSFLSFEYNARLGAGMLIAQLSWSQFQKLSKNVKFKKRY